MWGSALISRRRVGWILCSLVVDRYRGSCCRSNIQSPGSQSPQPHPLRGSPEPGEKRRGSATRNLAEMLWFVGNFCVIGRGSLGLPLTTIPSPLSTLALSSLVTFPHSLTHSLTRRRLLGLIIMMMLQP